MHQLVHAGQSMLDVPDDWSESDGPFSLADKFRLCLAAIGAPLAEITANLIPAGNDAAEAERVEQAALRLINRQKKSS